MASAAERPPARGHAALVSAIAVLVLAAALVVVLDWRQVGRLLGQTRWTLVVPALTATAGSYLALSAGMVAVGRIVGVRAPTGPLFRASYVSFALNHVLSLGGVAGYSVRTALLREHGESPGSVLAMTVVQSYLNTVAMLALLPAGLLLLAAVHPLSGAGAGAALVAGALSAVAVLALTAALWSRRARGALLRAGRWGTRVALGAGRARHAAAALDDLGAGLDRAATAVRARPAAGLAPALLIVADWGVTLVAFWCCLAAVGAGAGFAAALTAFAVGVNAGVASFVPGGLGVQEGSITATLAVLGVSVEHAALAAILFRVVYYFVPFAVSLPLYWPLLRGESGPDGASR